MKLQFVILIIVVGSFVKVNAQNNKLGVGIGYYEDKLKSLNLRYYFNNVCEDCQELNLWIEPSYEKINKNSYNADYLSLGLGGDLFIGKKISFIMGGGLSIRNLISFDSYYYQIKEHVLSIKVNSGVGFNFSNLYLTVKGIYMKDISTTYEYNDFNPGGMFSGVEEIAEKYMYGTVELIFVFPNKRN